MNLAKKVVYISAQSVDLHYIGKYVPFRWFITRDETTFFREKAIYSAVPLQNRFTAPETASDEADTP